MMAQPQQPSMFAQMATTAAGVAVGSAVGHTLGHAMTGAMSGSGSQEAGAPAPVAAAPAPTGYAPADPNGGLCNFELRQFIECAQNQHDLTLCDGFNEVLKSCKTRHGMA